jgi:hypothetical protein
MVRTVRDDDGVGTRKRSPERYSHGNFPIAGSASSSSGAHFRQHRFLERRLQSNLPIRRCGPSLARSNLNTKALTNSIYCRQYFYIVLLHFYTTLC